MSRKSTKRPGRAAAPRRLTRWSALAGAGVAGLLLGSLLFEPMLRRLAPGLFVVDTVSVAGARRVSVEELDSIRSRMPTPKVFGRRGGPGSKAGE